MKKLILPMCCVVVLIGCTMQKKPQAKTEIGVGTPYFFTPEFLKGKVKSVTQRAYWATEKDGEYLQGDLITRKERDSIGWSDDFIVYFDPQGITTRVEYLGDDGQPYGQWKISSEEGKYTGGQWFEGDSTWSYWIWTNDENGNLVKTERFRAEADTLLNRSDVTSIKGFQWSTLHDYDHTGKDLRTITRTFNEMGLVTASETKDPDGKVIAWWKYTYDEKGLQTSYKGMARDSTMYDIEMKYTDFDDRGNWIKMISLKEGRLDGMDVRTITYY